MRARSSDAACDVAYEIAVEHGRAEGTIRKARFLDPDVPARRLVGKRCFTAFAQRSSPCADCPAFAADGAVEPHDVVLEIPGSNAAVRSVSTRPRGATIQVTSRTIDLRAVPALVRLEFDRLARAAELSTREREVLALLLLGRSLEQIGGALGIRIRTAKFHTANVLRKLGADSRADLLRLLL